MNIIWFFLGIALIIIAQAVFLSLLVRFTIARLYSDLEKWFTPAKEGELSQFGIVVNGIVDNIAANVATKAKMSFLGEVGGKAPKSPRFTGNKFIDGIIEAAAPSLIGKYLNNQGPGVIPANNGNHSQSKLGF
jgi:hypothetical protein